MNLNSSSICLIIILACLAGACTPLEEQPAPEHPNVLFIIADDYGYHDMSSMGSEFYDTPHLDRLAARSMVFTQGYTAGRVCSPARASIMSGKTPARHGITDWLGARTGTDWREQGRHSKLLPPDYVDHLPHEYQVLPEAMRQEGYTTFFAGKWHLGGEGSYPEDHGFDFNQGGFEAGGPYTGGYFSPFNNPKMEDHPEEKGMSLPEKLAKETSRFIREHRDRPFFAFLSFYAVHAPIQTTRANWSKYRDKADSLGIAEKGFEMGYFLPIRQVQDNPVYAGLVEHMDDAVGQVLETLRSEGLDDNTIVIFTSDHGGVAAGDDYATSNRPLRGGKGYQYEGGLRVPYFISVPWMDHGGTEESTPVTGTDFYPTILDLAGADLRPEEHQDGVSLRPLLEGEPIPERPLFWHYPHYGNQGGRPSSVIRQGRWKLIRYHADSSQVLYDLQADLPEQADLSARHPEVAERLGSRLTEYLQETGAKFPRKDPQYDPQKEAEYLQQIEQELLPRLERQRMEFLSPDYNPGNNWWGSQVEE
ncbi:sulfatase [Halalkalibaculum sp. DA3122]|uniref:sulfatase n=1 Tax=Halalkalibaculum sp. DA3122 TaxID=3373607 RepID=UPI003753FC28